MTTHADTTERVPAAVRRRAYHVALAIISLLIVYGLIDGEQAAAWSNLAAAIIGATTAGLGTAYRPTPDTTETEQ